MTNTFKSSKSYFEINKIKRSIKDRAPLIAVTISSTSLISLKNELGFLSNKYFDLIEIRGDYFIKDFKKSLKEKDDELSKEYFIEKNMSKFIAHQTKEFLSEIKKTFKDKKIIFTLRSDKEGGFFNGDYKDYFEINSLVLKKDIDFIDIEYLRLKDLKENIDKKCTEDFSYFSIEKYKKELGLILSYHNINKAVNSKKIIELFEKMESYSPELIKIVYSAEKSSDIYPLFYASKLLKKKKNPYSLLNMGKLGYVSRYLALAFGSSLVFAEGFRSSAKGQVKTEALISFYELYLDKTKNKSNLQN